MTEFADKYLEELVPVFEQLKRQEILTELELKLVIKKCKAFEYKLQRRVKDKHDYIKYAQYLVLFLALVRTRRIEMDFWQLRAEIDKAVGFKVDNLLKRACFRFQDDLKLWLTRINFLKQKKANHAVSKTYLRMLQIHGSSAANWLLAAKFEFDENKSVENARGLLQRGIRYLPRSEKLWIELFRLELLYVEKLKKRQEMIKPLVKSPAPSPDTAVEIIEPVFEVNTIVHDESDCPNASMNEEVGLMSLELAKVVMLESLELFDNPAFCAQLLSVAGLFEFAKELQGEIICIIRKKYGENEDIWKFFAELKEHDKCVETYEEAIRILPTAKMHAHFIEYLSVSLDQLRSGKINQMESHGRLLEEFAKAEVLKLLTEAQYLDYIYHCSEDEEAASAIDSGLAVYPKSVTLWHLKFARLLQNCHPQSAKAVTKMLEECVSELNEAESLPVWMLVVQWMAAHCSKRLMHTLEKAIKIHSNVANPCRLFYLNYVYQVKGIEAGRNLFSRLALMRSNSVEFYEQFAKLELSHKNVDSHYIRQAYEYAILDHGTSNPDIWLNFIGFEMIPQIGRLDKVANLYKRAKQNLDKHNLNDFMIRYSALK